MNIFGYVIGATELNPVRVSAINAHIAQQQTIITPEVPISSREVIHSQGSSTRHSNSIIPHSNNALPTVHI